VVQVRSEDVSPEAIGDAVVAALRQAIDDLDDGALVTVEPNRMRVRLLPLRP
jgi:predicted nuclease of predicted toxin-antitoxin system